MTLENTFHLIDSYLHKEGVCAPRFVNVESVKEMAAVVEHYRVGENVFLTVEQYSSEDENPRFEDLLHDLATKRGNLFLTGFTTSWKFMGAKELSSRLTTIANTKIEGHVVVLCFQCNDYLNFKDPRLEERVYRVDGDPDTKPHIIFVNPTLQVTNGDYVEGIQNLPAFLESINANVFRVKTRRRPEEFPDALFMISEEANPYDSLRRIDPSTEALAKELGTDEQWAYALTLLREQKDWSNAIAHEIGSCRHLDSTFKASQSYTDTNKWLYLIALKLFGSNNKILATASQKARTYEELLRKILRAIVALDCKSPEFWELYESRKALLNDINLSDEEALDYCNEIRRQKRDALYYLTDKSRPEKELILETIANYSESYSHDELRSVLQHIYPDLCSYLTPYKFDAELLNQYFEMYKFCKLENRITSEFYALVEEQGIKREFNRLLPTRSEKLEAVDMSNACAYFIDAMGVEFLGYISVKAKQKNLRAKITVCRSELPSITSCNKEFLEVFNDHNVQYKSDKKLDEIKHHGAENFTLDRCLYPIHLIRELEIIDQQLTIIRSELAQGKYAKAIMISDHGASRLVLLKDQLIDGDFDAKGAHGGRVGEYTEETAKLPMVIQAGENDKYAVVANYQRFRPGLLRGVEAHGGATLEEVAIPIIELSYLPGDIEINVQTTLVKSGVKKPPVVEFYSNTKIDNIIVKVGNTDYKAKTSDGNLFSIEMSKRTRAGAYTAEVYAGGTLIADGLEFKVEKEGFKTNDIL